MCDHKQSDYSGNIYSIQKKKRKKCVSRETGHHTDAGYTHSIHKHIHTGVRLESPVIVPLWNVSGNTRVLLAELARLTERLLARNGPRRVRSGFKAY